MNKKITSNLFLCNLEKYILTHISEPVHSTKLRNCFFKCIYRSSENHLLVDLGGDTERGAPQFEVFTIYLFFISTQHSPHSRGF